METAYRVTAKGRVYWYAWRGGPLVYRCFVEDEAALADDIARAFLARQDQRAYEGTLSWVIEQYQLSADWLDLAEATRKENARALERIKAGLGALNGPELTRGGKRVLAFLGDVEAKHGARAADRCRDVLSRVCSWARAPAQELLPRDCRPTEGIKHRYTAPVQAAPMLADVTGAIAALRYAGRYHLADVLEVALNTGLRRRDLCRLDWSAVDWTAGRILWAPSKGARKRRRVVIPLTPALRAVLHRIGPRVAGPVLRTTRDEGWTPDGLSASLDAALRGLGAPWRLHAVRRACATHLAAQGWSSRQIARVLGWAEAEAEAMAATYVDEAQNPLQNTPSTL